MKQIESMNFDEIINECRSLATTVTEQSAVRDIEALYDEGSTSFAVDTAQELLGRLREKNLPEWADVEFAKEAGLI